MPNYEKPKDPEQTLPVDMDKPGEGAPEAPAVNEVPAVRITSVTSQISPLQHNAVKPRKDDPEGLRSSLPNKFRRLMIPGLGAAATAAVLTGTGIVAAINFMNTDTGEQATRSHDNERHCVPRHETVKALSLGAAATQQLLTGNLPGNVGKLRDKNSQTQPYGIRFVLNETDPRPTAAEQVTLFRMGTQIREQLGMTAIGENGVAVLGWSTDEDVRREPHLTGKKWHQLDLSPGTSQIQTFTVETHCTQGNPRTIHMQELRAPAPQPQPAAS